MNKIEGTVYEGAANHFVGIESVGGRLYLTQDTLIFVSHGLNIQTHRMDIPLKDITEINTRNTLGFVPNGLLVHTALDTQERFVVNKRKTWIAKINALREM